MWVNRTKINTRSLLVTVRRSLATNNTATREYCCSSSGPLVSFRGNLPPTPTASYIHANWLLLTITLTILRGPPLEITQWLLPLLADCSLTACEKRSSASPINYEYDVALNCNADAPYAALCTIMSRDIRIGSVYVVRAVSWARCTSVWRLLVEW